MTHVSGGWRVSASSIGLQPLPHIHARMSNTPIALMSPPTSALSPSDPMPVQLPVVDGQLYRGLRQKLCLPGTWSAAC